MTAISKLQECQLGNLEKLLLRLHHNMKRFVYVEKEKHFRMNQFGDSIATCYDIMLYCWWV